MNTGGGQKVTLSFLQNVILRCIGLKWPMTQVADGHLGWPKWPMVDFDGPVMSPGLKSPPWSAH